VCECCMAVDRWRDWRLFLCFGVLCAVSADVLLGTGVGGSSFVFMIRTPSRWSGRLTDGGLVVT